MCHTDDFRIRRFGLVLSNLDIEELGAKLEEINQAERKAISESRRKILR
jgi:hypothetical protein